MAKEELIEMHGSVTEVLPDGRYRVTLDNGHNLIAYSGGKMRKHHIHIIAGDNVSLEMSPHDLSKGADHLPPPARPSGRRRRCAPAPALRRARSTRGGIEPPSSLTRPSRAARRFATSFRCHSRNDPAQGVVSGHPRHPRGDRHDANHPPFRNSPPKTSAASSTACSPPPASTAADFSRASPPPASRWPSSRSMPAP